MWGTPPTPLCSRCGLYHYSHSLCPSFSSPTVDAMVTGGQMEEEASIRRWTAYENLAAGIREAAARADSMARLENALRSL